ncbi:hypothetical protein COY29_05910 [Candidatus Woesebacteria bacterium CG_4_10_14_0_2_um_filter_39_14]|uniref:Uncharacterized protein n=1 Tax=Candidatus Woesebacteria bacterium CG_4_10_14_0_2_um_filter_39_14 TaxID=1975054 RepID=A0A2M7TJQ1_9BACT|nr:MAG: hypothetical protein COY29_05910 [Candidatus Woesebacteria bacterium CG_4_10_14_0_2_um_filter_39_14]
MINKILAMLTPGDGGGGSAGINNPVLGPKLQGKTGLQFFQTFLPHLLTIGLIIGVLFFFFIIIIGAIQWISSGGDKNALEEAKHKITNAIIGVVILFSIFAILKLIENFFGISILTLDIGSLAI